jgi:putative ABC transport system ATP-binding protein
MPKNSVSKQLDANASVIQLIGVTREYIVGGIQTTALDDIHLSVRSGEFVSVVGRSGSGKSTLMNMVTGIDHPTRGDVIVMGTHTHQLPENRMAAWRGDNLGIVFQFYQLLPTLSLLDNVLLPMQLINSKTRAVQLERVKNLLTAVDLWQKKDKFPAQLSGGEQQRAAVARAMANDPPILIADEPTGNLSSSEAGGVMAILKNMVSNGKSVVFVTHDLDLAETAHRKVTLSDGCIIDDSKTNPSRKKAVGRKK